MRSETHRCVGLEGSERLPLFQRAKIQPTAARCIRRERCGAPPAGAHASQFHGAGGDSGPDWIAGCSTAFSGNSNLHGESSLAVNSAYRTTALFLNPPARTAALFP